MRPGLRPHSASDVVGDLNARADGTRCHRSATLRHVIIVLGRPGLSAPQPNAAAPRLDADDRADLHGLAVLVAVAASAAGGAVQLVGSVGDDREGDEVIIRLGRANVGHAALLRDPAGRTPVAGQEREPAPRLDAEDVELGLRYLAEIRVLILAEPLDGDAQSAALEAARYHGAQVIVLVPPGSAPDADLAVAGTVLEAPSEDIAAFVRVVGRFAAELEAGRPAAEAFQEATAATGWERAET